MKNLEKLLVAEQLKVKKDRLKMINKIKSTNSKDLEWSLHTLLPKAKENYEFPNLPALKAYLINRLDLDIQNRMNTNIAKLDFKSDLASINEIIINVEWRKSKMWGTNPTAETYVSGLGQLTSGSIGGCGYDKQSTAVAIILNQIPQFLQLLYSLKNKNHKIKNHDLFGYGSGYGVLPKFEGGVGVECYDAIFNKIGYKFHKVSSGRTFNVFSIKKLEKKNKKA